jgi:putative tryptophan/tyrosine transport system substrate-binding protein
MDRRTFVSALAGSLLAAPLAAEAQRQNRVFRVGFLRSGQPPKAFIDEFQQGLRALGYVAGQNIVIEYRFTDGSIDPLPRLAAELVRLKVDVILASTGPAALAAQSVTNTVPIVFVIPDPEGLGIVPNLAHPGGNVTGLAMSSADLPGKRLQLLKEVVSKLPRVAVLWHPANPTDQVQAKEAQASVGALDLQLQLVPVWGPDDFEWAFEAARGAGGLLQLDGVLFTTYRTRLVNLAIKSRLPAIYGFKEFPDAGGLMSYGAHLPDLYRRAAAYVDKILKGANPGDLPVEQPTKFELVINLKTAKALGLTIPQPLLLRADEVIE